MSGAAAPPARASATSGARSASRWTAWRARLESPTTTYYLLLSVTGVLITIGLVMVLSASMIVSIKDTADGSPYSIFLDQLKFAAIGAVVMAVAARMSVRRWKQLAVPSLVVAIGMQLLVFSPVGVGHQGNRNWIDLQVFYLQPSEVGKVALVLFGAAILTRKRPLLGRFQHAVVPYVVPCAVAVVTLVMMGKDLGTVLVLGAITAGVLFAAGMRARYFLLGGVLAGRARRDGGPGQLEPDGADQHLAGQLPVRPVRHLPAATPRPVRPRRRWLARGGTRCEPGEVALPPGAAQRLHLRDHRGGARPAGHLRHPRACSPSSRWPATAWCRGPTTSSSGSRRLAS